MIHIQNGFGLVEGGQDLIAPPGRVQTAGIGNERCGDFDVARPIELLEYLDALSLQVR
jgi:hypothetical protein